MEWFKTEDVFPEECRPVLARVMADGCQAVVMLTMVWGKWVTDATISEVYGCDSHVEIAQEYIPIEWAYFDD